MGGSSVTTLFVLTTVTVLGTALQQDDVPSSVVTLTLSREGQEQLAGSSLTITASISVDRNVDTPHTVSVVWDKDGSSLSSNERISISDVSSVTGINQYQAQIMFSTLSSVVDSGAYTCIVQVDSDSTYTYTTSTSDTASTTIDVNDPAIVLVIDLIAEFAEVQTMCDYAENFVQLNLICTANKSVEVIPELGVIWLRGGTETVGGAEYTDGGSVVTTTVMLSRAEVVDTNYTCSAKLIVPESNNVNNLRVLEVVFKGPRSEIFQLRIVQFPQCRSKTMQPSIVALIRTQVTEAIRNECQCEFQEYLIDQSVLVCDELGAMVFRATIFSSTAYLDVNTLVRFIEDWVKKGPSITTGAGVLMFDPDFPIMDSSRDGLECVETSPSSSPTTSPSEIDSLGIIILVFVIAIVLGGPLMICAGVIVGICCSTKHKSKTHFAPKGKVERTRHMFAKLLAMGKSLKIYEMGEKLGTANGRNKASDEVATNPSRPDRSDPVFKQYCCLEKMCMFAKPIKLDKPDTFEDNFNNATSICC